MCVSVPGEVVSVSGGKALVDLFGEKRYVNNDFVNIKKGDHVLVFHDVAIEKIGRERFEEIRKGMMGC